MSITLVLVVVFLGIGGFLGRFKVFAYFIATAIIWVVTLFAIAAKVGNPAAVVDPHALLVGALLCTLGLLGGYLLGSALASNVFSGLPHRHYGR